MNPDPTPHPDEDLTQLVCWLAGIVMQYHDFRHEAIAPSMTPEEIREFVTMKFPVVQGHSLQTKLRQLGERPIDQAALRRAMAALIPPQPPTETQP